jgi:hypothetical protein
LVCIESPEVRFEEIMTVYPSRTFTEVPIDKRFIACCEPNTIAATSACPSNPAIVSARVHKDNLIVEVLGQLPQSVTVKLSGVRIGYGNTRFQECNRAEMEANNIFWSKQWTGG